MKFWSLPFILLFPVLAHAESSALIISGVPGDEKFAAKYSKWTETTRKILTEEMGFTPNRVIVLADEKSTQANIKDAFAKLKDQLKPADSFFLFLIGHGSFEDIVLGSSSSSGRNAPGGAPPLGRGAPPSLGGAPPSLNGPSGRGGQAAVGGYKFNNAGPDLTDKDISDLLSTLSAGRIVVVNGTSNSGGGTEAMAAKNRMIISATKSGFEGNDTVFYEYFLNGLQKAAADENKDHKVSVWEAFKFAVDGTERFYKDAGRIATEHPQISDNGGPMTGVLPQAPVMAGLTIFNVDVPVTVADAKLQALLNQQKDLQQQIETLQINKASMPPDDFNKKFEDLIIKLSTVGQQIEEQKKK